MNDQPAVKSPFANPVAGGSVTEPKPENSGPISFEAELLGLAVNANELIARIHAGHSGDLNSMIKSVIEARPVADPLAGLQDAA